MARVVDVVERRRRRAGEAVRVARAGDARVGAGARVAGRVGEVRVHPRDGPVVRIEPQVLLGVAGDADAVDGRVEVEAEARSRKGGDERRRAHLARSPGPRIDDVEAARLPEREQLPVEKEADR